MIGIQFAVNFSVQLAFLVQVYSNFNFVGYTVQEFLVFALAWLLSDLAVLFYLLELVIATHGRVFSAKLEKVPSSILDRLRSEHPR